MANLMEITDLWTIKINSEKYGELYFSRISDNLSDIVSTVKSNPDNCIEILMKNSFSENRNKVKLEQIDFSLLSETEKMNFFRNFLSIQFDL